MGLQIWIPGSITDTDTGVPKHHWSPHSKIINHSYASVAGLSQDINLTCGFIFYLCSCASLKCTSQLLPLYSRIQSLLVSAWWIYSQITLATSSLIGAPGNLQQLIDPKVLKKTHLRLLKFHEASKLNLFFQFSVSPILQN